MATKTTPQICVVLATCPNRALARRVAKVLVGRRLAACVNVLPGVESVFTWKGKTERAREVLLIIKTTARRFKTLRRTIVSQLDCTRGTGALQRRGVIAMRPSNRQTGGRVARASRPDFCL